MIKTKYIAALTALFCSALPLGAETIFFEDFDHYGYYPANFNPGVCVSEEPGSLKRLRISPKDRKYIQALKTPFMIPEAKRIADAELTFMFRPHGNEAGRSYDVHLLFAAKRGAALNEMKSITVKLNSDGNSVLEGGAVKSGRTGQLASVEPFFAGQWYPVCVCMSGGGISLAVDRGRECVEYSANLPKEFMLAGINFGGAFGFDVDEVKVAAPGKRTPSEKYAVTPQPAFEKQSSTVSDGKNPLIIRPFREQYGFSISNIGSSGKIELKFEDGSPEPLTAVMKSFTQNTEWKVMKTVTETKDGQSVTTRKIEDAPVKIEDSGLAFSCGKTGIRMYTVPLVYDRFEAWQARSVIRNALDGKYDRAGNHNWIFRLVKTGKTAQLWIDGSFVMNLPLKNELKTVAVSIPQGAIFSPLKLSEEKRGPLFQKVDMPSAGFDTGVCREFLGSCDLECDGYLSRSAFDAPPCSMLRRVPNAQYIRAHLVCSLGENDPEKSTDVTARITRYISGGSQGRTPQALADCTVTLPRSEKDSCPPGVKRLGGGKFLVTCDIPVGKIQDIVFMENRDYIDFEVLGGLWEKNIYYISREGKPAARPSNVMVHEAVLEKSPVSMMVENGRLANLFYPDEEAFVTAKLTALKPGGYAVNWIVKDIDGNIIDNTTDEVKFSAAGETKAVKKSFRQKENGHYITEVRLKDAGGNTLVTFNGSFSRIAADTRRAGYESPYASWNFGGAHGTPRNPAVYGEMYKRMGVRRVTGGWKSEADVPKEYGPITLCHFSHIGPKGKTPEERGKSLEVRIKELTKNFPHVKTAMIFHESGHGATPLELIGGRTEMTERVKAQDARTAGIALEIANAWRKYAPDVKLVIGNTGVSIGCIGALFRTKYPADRIDFMGEESVGMSIPPERSVAYPSWMLSEVARIFGYGNVRPEACYEWKDRVERDCDSDRVCASWRVRDILTAHAWNYQLIPAGGISEVGNSYYNTVWGSGNCTRWPLLQPYPAMTAVCVATQVLDCVKPLRLVPTGTPTVYVLEFRRGNEFVYACWTARGEVKTKVDFGGAKVTLTGFYGRTSDLKSDEITITQEPCYLVSGTRIKSASAALERSYPWEEYGMKNAKVACAMDKIDGWKLVTGEDRRILAPDDADELYLSSLRPGKFNFTQVKDDRKGDCLEVTLIPEGDCPALMREYGFIRMDKPAPIEGTPSTLGVWVKGNSSWGKLFYEIEDADGEVWISAGTGGYGCPVYDWCEQMGINFDGWHFVQFPLTGASPVKIHSPGDNQWQWQSERTGDGRITFPVKVRGIGFALARKTLNLTKMEDVKNLSVRFKDFSAY